MYGILQKRIERRDLPIMGTCAGCVLLAKELIDNEKDIKLLEAIDMQVERNAFGRQRESFEQLITIKGFTTPFNAVFIRAPRIIKIWGTCEVLATAKQEIVMVKQDNILALAFHPEITHDLRIHHLFLNMIR